LIQAIGRLHDLSELVSALENEVKKTPFKSPVATARTYPVVKETPGGLIGTICKGVGAIAIASGLCETH
jgi:hypothetical protein